MLTNTASDQDSRVFKCTDVCPYPAALIAGVAGESDASPPETLGMGCLAVTWDTSHFRDVVVVLISSASDIRRHVSDQSTSRDAAHAPERALRAERTLKDPFTARLIADGHVVGATRHASTAGGIRDGVTSPDADAPSTQRHSRAARLPPWRCVLSPSVAAQTQRVREGVEKCSSHAAIRDCSRDATSARLKIHRPRFAWPMRIARMPPTWPCVRASRRTVDSSMPSTSASSVALYVLRSGLRLMLAPALAVICCSLAVEAGAIRAPNRISPVVGMLRLQCQLA